MAIRTPHFKRLPRDFYIQPTVRLARQLLGKIFVRPLGKKLLVGRIVETEAYTHNDPACHAYKGRTPRTEVMFWEGGFLYVYFTYGMHFCTCVVSSREGRGEAVLIRGVEPLTGIEVMTKNRGFSLARGGKESLKKLTDGPGKFSKAFGLGRIENGLSLLQSPVFIADAESVASSHVGISSRIGITSAAAKKQWRFFEKGNLWVSR